MQLSMDLLLLNFHEITEIKAWSSKQINKPMRLFLSSIQGQDFALAPFHTSIPHKHIHEGMTYLSVFIDVGMETQQYHGL